MIPKAFVDTNVLMHLTDKGSDRHEISRSCLGLFSGGPKPYVVLQNLAEFWAQRIFNKKIKLQEKGVSSRKLALLLTQEKSVINADVLGLMRWVRLLEYDKEPFLYWLYLMTNHKLGGRDVHDARLVATMLANNIQYMISFDKDFEKYDDIIWLKPEQFIEQFS